MRAALIAIVLSSVGRAVCAQPADEGSKTLDTCFELARAADANCSDPKNGAAERMNCRQKASMAQLECLERVFPGRSAESFPPEMSPRPVSPEMPTVTASRSTCRVRFTREACWNHGQRRAHQLAKNASRNRSTGNAYCSRLAREDNRYFPARCTREARRYPCKATGYRLDRK